MDVKKDPNEKPGPTLGVRHLQMLLLFLNIVVTYMSRLNVAVAVVAMTNADRSNPKFPEYDWTEMQKQYVISSFYWGYIITQFPGGYLCKRFGVKIVLLISVLGSAAAGLITPWCIPWGGWQIFCGIRILQGIFQGVMFPSIYEHLAKWCPTEERNLLGAIVHTGVECGTILAMGLSGLIASGPLGWPGISYISSTLCFIWCILWIFLAANNAPASKLISPDELKYIESSLQRSDDFHKKKIPVPWRAIGTSVPFYALIIVRICQTWGYTTLQAEIPSYLNGVLDMNIKNNAIFSALPYIAMIVMAYIYMFVADIIINRKYMSLTAIRKTFNTLAMWIPAVTLIGIGFLDQNQQTLAITLMTVTVGINAGYTIGSALNTIDLSPNHAGILMGISNPIANIIPIITPLVTGVIVRDTHERSQWQIVFLISAIIFFVGNLIYIIWGIAEPQPWNDPDYMQQRNILNADMGKCNMVFESEEKTTPEKCTKVSKIS